MLIRWSVCRSGMWSSVCLSAHIHRPIITGLPVLGEEVRREGERGREREREGETRRQGEGEIKREIEREEQVWKQGGKGGGSREREREREGELWKEGGREGGRKGERGGGGVIMECLSLCCHGDTCMAFLLPATAWQLLPVAVATTGGRGTGEHTMTVGGRLPGMAAIHCSPHHAAELRHPLPSH